MAQYQAIRTAFIPDAEGSVSGRQIWFGEIAEYATPPTGIEAAIFRPYPVVPYNQADLEVAGGAGKAVLTVQGSGRYPLDLRIYPNDPGAVGGPGVSFTWTATADGQTKDIPYTAAGTYSPLIVAPDGMRETFTVAVTAAPPPPPPPAPVAKAPAPAPAPKVEE